MGVSVGMSRCSAGCGCGGCTPQAKTKYPNPNPRNFEIRDVTVIGKYLVADVDYPDCTNYEGRKIMVYCNVLRSELERQQTLDPHFCDGEHMSPVARFVPTKEGKKMAIAFCYAMEEIE